jgi:catechol 2,3-dioxygenase-like lactoylglutathione lyase family enzyme
MKRTLLALGLLASCAPHEVEKAKESKAPPPIIANNAFFYYADVEAAWRFYTEVLGVDTVADYGFAKILHLADTSYLILVDAAEGMHTAEEPKTVALALVTDELEGWHEYLKSEGVEMRNELSIEEGEPHDGFVAYDPEGYYLEFERFNSHPENEKLLPLLERAPSFYPGEEASTRRPKELGIRATILWMYYKDMDAIQRFYGDVMGFEQVVDQGWAKIYQTSPTGFIGPVDETRGMHRFTQDKGVTASWFTEDVDGWFEYLKTQSAFTFRTPEIMDESGKVRVFVGYDPENYFLEFDTFLDVEGNEELVRRLARR